MSVEVAEAFFSTLGSTDRERAIAQQIFKEIRARFGFLTNVGLGYLNLSTGRQPRSRAASRSAFVSRRRSARRSSGVLYILDEPSIGLHQRDNDRLLATLQTLRDIGNTLIIIEHDEDTMRAADVIVDVGPGAGAEGGHILSCGPIEEILANPESLTGAYLSGRQFIAIPKTRRKGKATLAVKRREGEQPQGRQRRHSARHVHVRHGRERQRQVDARQSRSLSRRSTSISIINRPAAPTAWSGAPKNSIRWS